MRHSSCDIEENSTCWVGLMKTRKILFHECWWENGVLCHNLKNSCYQSSAPSVSLCADKYAEAVLPCVVCTREHACDCTLCTLPRHAPLPDCRFFIYAAEQQLLKDAHPTDRACISICQFLAHQHAWYGIRSLQLQSGAGSSRASFFSFRHLHLHQG